MKIAIDPDSKLNGVCIVENGDYKLQSLSFPILIDFLRENKAKIERVTIELGSFIKTANFHVKNDESAAYNSKIAGNVGANIQTAKLIVEYIEHLGINCIKISPKTRAAVERLVYSMYGLDYKNKVNSTNFKIITGQKVSNQDERDAFFIELTNANKIEFIGNFIKI